MTNRLFKGVMLVFAMLTVPVYAQDVVNISFGQDGVDKDKKYHRIAVNFNYLSDCADLEKACTKFFFNDSVSATLEAAVKNYQAQFAKSKKFRTEPDVEHKFVLSIASNGSEKYTSYLLGRSDITYEGNKQTKKSLTWNVVYDNMNDRLLTVDDIFIPSEAAKIKEAIGKRLPQLFVTNNGVVWGYSLKGKLVQNQCLYKKNPEIYTEKFRKLIGGNAFDHDAIFANGSVDDYLRQTVKYPAEAQKNLEAGTVRVDFNVDADGSVKDVKVDDGVSPNLKQEMLRVVNGMRWTPAVRNGENVSSTQWVEVEFPTDVAECDTLTNYLFTNILSNIITEATAQKKKELTLACVVEADGSVSSVKIEGCTLSPQLNKKLIKLTSGAPKCIPAKMYDVGVRSRRTLPVTITKDGAKVTKSVQFTDLVITKLEEEIPVDDGNNEAADEVLKAKEVISHQDPNTGDTKVFDVVEQMPAFAGGIVKRSVRRPDGTVTMVSTEVGPGASGLMQFLSMSVRYPLEAEENGIQGRVIVSFVVERDGSITDVRVVKSVHPSLDREAVRVVKSMPKWIPGKQKGSPVRVKYTTPITFRLQ